MPTSVISPLPSAVKSNQSNVPIVFFVHPIEGLTAALKPLASALPYKAYGIECIREAPLDSITTLAKFYVDVCNAISLKILFFRIYLKKYFYSRST